METNNKTNIKSVVITIVAVVVVLVVGAIVYSIGHSASPAGTQDAINPTSANQAAPANAPQAASSSPSVYVSANDGFSIGFSGTPQVTTLTFNSPTAGPIPLTEYKEMASGGSPDAYDAVYVYHYPSTYQFASDYLDGALKTFEAVVSSKYPGSAIASQTSIQFLGNSALSAVITVPGAGGIEDDYLLVTTQGRNSYIISTYGMSQNDYNTFVNSFTFG